ncbi:hypothetical protein [Tsukamurella soli]|uniref:hypothetical protein n=1 Tax=Tsukamurella soli TaxID=644556 RepID=UPI0031EB711B
MGAHVLTHTTLTDWGTAMSLPAFCIDGSARTFPCAGFAEPWNGFAVPLVSAQTLYDFIAELNTLQSDVVYGIARAEDSMTLLDMASDGGCNDMLGYFQRVAPDLYAVDGFRLWVVDHE